MSGWGCPHELRGLCKRVKIKGRDERPKCDPGMKGCTLYGRYRFSSDAKNKPRRKIHGRKVGGGEE